MHEQLSHSLLPTPRTIGYINSASMRRESKLPPTLAVRSSPNPFVPVSNQPSPTVLPRDISSRFGIRLRDLRRSRNLTQLQMAVDFGIDRSFISDVERGRKSISLMFLEVIALGMDVKLSDLLRDL